MKQVTILYSGQSTREVPSTSHKSHIPPQFPDRCIKLTDLTDSTASHDLHGQKQSFIFPKTTGAINGLYEAMFSSH